LFCIGLDIGPITAVSASESVDKTSLVC